MPSPDHRTLPGGQSAQSPSLMCGVIVCTFLACCLYRFIERWEERHDIHSGPRLGSTGQPVSRRLQVERGLAHPAGQHRAVQIDPRAGADLSTAMQRTMLGVFGDQHLRYDALDQPSRHDVEPSQRDLRRSAPSPRNSRGRVRSLARSPARSAPDASEDGRDWVRREAASARATAMDRQPGLRLHFRTRASRSSNASWRSSAASFSGRLPYRKRSSSRFRCSRRRMCSD